MIVYLPSYGAAVSPSDTGNARASSGSDFTTVARKARRPETLYTVFWLKPRGTKKLQNQDESTHHVASRSRPRSSAACGTRVTELVHVKCRAPKHELEMGKAKGGLWGGCWQPHGVQGKPCWPMPAASPCRAARAAPHRAMLCVHALVLVGLQIATESANGRTSEASCSSLLNKSPEGRLELAGHCASISERCPLLPHRPLLKMQVPLAAEPRLAAAPFFCSLLHSFCCYCNQYLSLSASPLTRSDFSFCEGF